MTKSTLNQESSDMEYLIIISSKLSDTLTVEEYSFWEISLTNNSYLWDRAKTWVSSSHTETLLINRLLSKLLELCRFGFSHLIIAYENIVEMFALVIKNEIWWGHVSTITMEIIEELSKEDCSLPVWLTQESGELWKLLVLNNNLNNDCELILVRIMINIMDETNFWTNDKITKLLKEISNTIFNRIFCKHWLQIKQSKNRKEICKLWIFWFAKMSELYGLNAIPNESSRFIECLKTLQNHIFCNNRDVKLNIISIETLIFLWKDKNTKHQANINESIDMISNIQNKFNFMIINDPIDCFQIWPKLIEETINTLRICQKKLVHCPGCYDVTQIIFEILNFIQSCSNFHTYLDTSKLYPNKLNYQITKIFKFQEIIDKLSAIQTIDKVELLHKEAELKSISNFNQFLSNGMTACQIISIITTLPSKTIFNSNIYSNFENLFKLLLKLRNYKRIHDLSSYLIACYLESSEILYPEKLLLCEKIWIVINNQKHQIESINNFHGQIIHTFQSLILQHLCYEKVPDWCKLKDYSEILNYDFEKRKTCFINLLEMLDDVNWNISLKTYLKSINKAQDKLICCKGVCKALGCVPIPNKNVVVEILDGTKIDFIKRLSCDKTSEKGKTTESK